VDEVEAQIREALEFHLDGMREEGLPTPSPRSTEEYMEIAAR
jgi:predicted RNase H-like HicB family nuclease